MPGSGVRRISSERLADLLHAGGGDAPLLLDVRTPEEFAAGHAPGAQNIPLEDLAELLSELPRERRLALCGDGGDRVTRAARLLVKSGYAVLLQMPLKPAGP